ncbi:hypothetical protein ACFLTG_02470 [Chloroflexota bacterium]
MSRKYYVASDDEEYNGHDHRNACRYAPADAGNDAKDDSDPDAETTTGNVA